MAKYNIAMLSQQEEPRNVVGPDSIAMLGYQAEDAISEAVEQQVAMERAQQVIDDAEEVVRDAEEEKVALEQARLHGGVDQVAMEAFQRAVRRFEKRTGVSCRSSQISLEGFASKATRMQSTSVALEGTKEFIGKVIKMLMDAITWVIDKVKGFFDKLFLGTERLAERARQLLAAAKQLRGKAAVNAGGIVLASAMMYARLNDKVVEGAEFVKEYARQMAPEFPSRKAISDGINGALKNNIFTDLINKAKKPDNEAEIAETIAEVQIVPNSKGEEEGVVSSPFKRMLGEFVLTITSFSPHVLWEQVKSGFRNIRNRFSRAEGAKEEVAQSLEPLSVDEVTELCQAALDNMKNYDKVRAEQKGISDRMKKIISDARQMATGVADGVSDQINVSVGFIRTWLTTFTQSMVSFFSYDAGLTKAALDYAAASLNAIKGTANAA